MIKHLFIVVFCTLLLLPLKGHSQKSVIHDQPRADYRLALELFEKGQYGAAMQLFENVVQQLGTTESQMQINARLHVALSAAQLFHADAEEKLSAFLTQHPTHVQQNLARFQLGNVIYRDRRYAEAARLFAQVRVEDLSPNLHYEYYFKRGYSHFMTRNYALARQHFLEIRNENSPYFPPATYYLGHIAFEEGSLATALTAFRRLENDPTFGEVVPYYIVNILYLQKEYDQLIAYAVPLLSRATPRRVPEIQRLIGEAWFRKGQFERALPYLEAFMGQSQHAPDRNDRYLLAFTYFNLNRWQDAITQFEQVTGGNDALAQNAHFHLASAYIRANQHRLARNAFRAAFTNNHDPAITQDAIFHYAKLSFQLDLDHYNEAVEYFQKYIRDYPNSARVNEATGYLVDIFLSTRNYREALASLERMQLNTPRLRAAYQRVSFNRGVELFNNNNFAEAIRHFDMSQTHPVNSPLNARSIYWEGQAHYRLQNYSQAIAAMQQFLTAPGAIGLDVFHQAHYTIGYSHFNTSNYQAAITAFRRFITASGQENRLLHDAMLRIGDSYFMLSQFAQAIEFYNRAINQNAIDSEYAMFQVGMAFGAMGRHSEKISRLENLITTNPTSTFVDDALYELGNSWLLLLNNAQAMQSFSRLIAQHPNSSLTKSAMLKSGLIHFNDNRDDKALETFRNVVTRYPGTTQSQEALAAMRNIYVEQGRVDEFITFSQGLGFANVTVAQQDSLTYMAAEAQFMRGDCANATRSFTTYLSRFPNGIFSINANFYLAECHLRANELELALRGFRFVIDRPRTGFTENALRRAAAIESQLGNHAAALELFRRLETAADLHPNRVEAQIGQARSLFHLQRFRDCIISANAVAINPRATTEIQQEAHLLAGKSAIELSQPVPARNSLRSAKDLINNVVAAEAMYYLALIEYQAGNFQQAERLIFDFASRMSAHDYWLAKSFILLADAYLAMGNVFQAKHTLQSIIDNYQGSELRAVAIQKLDAILEAERRQQPARQAPAEIRIGRN